MPTARHFYLHRALEDIEASAGGLPADVLAHAQGERWSGAGILEHLTLAFTLNRTALEKALASGQLKARPPAVTEWLARVLVLDLGYFPRAEAPQGTRPTGSVPPDRSLAATCEALLALDETLWQVAARFGEQARVANHPYFGGLTVPQWRRFHWQHTRHHMRQVRALR